MDGLCYNCKSKIKFKRYSRDILLFHPCETCGQSTQATVKHGYTHYFQMSKPRGNEIAEVYSVRLPPTEHDEVVKKHGSLRKAIGWANNQPKGDE